VTAPPASDARLRGEPVARAVFAGLPARYDRLAYLLSLGQDRRWRRAVVARTAAGPPRLVLDVATGPAGIALAVAAATGADVVGVDRLMLGSDYPFPIGDMRPRDIIREAGFDDATRQAIEGGTARRLFGL